MIETDILEAMKTGMAYSAKKIKAKLKLPETTHKISRILQKLEKEGAVLRSKNSTKNVQRWKICEGYI